MTIDGPHLSSITGWEHRGTLCTAAGDGGRDGPRPGGEGAAGAAWTLRAPGRPWGQGGQRLLRHQGGQGEQGAGGPEGASRHPRSPGHSGLWWCPGSPGQWRQIRPQGGKGSEFTTYFLMLSNCLFQASRAGQGRQERRAPLAWWWGLMPCPGSRQEALKASRRGSRVRVDLRGSRGRKARRGLTDPVVRLDPRGWGGRRGSRVFLDLLASRESGESLDLLGTLLSSRWRAVAGAGPGARPLSPPPPLSRLAEFRFILDGIYEYCR